MEKLAIHLALHGVAVLTVSVLAGLFLYRAILKDTGVANWHLVHAGGTARGIMLIALASIIHLPVLPPKLLSVLVWLLIFFTWTSTLAMITRAFSGKKGFSFVDSKANKFVYTLYVMGTIAIFPALLLLIIGLLKSLYLQL